MINKNIEQWVSVKGYEGLYMVSSCGNIGSSYQNKLLKQTKSSNGYYHVSLWKDKKPTNKTVHSIVAESFLNYIPNGQTIIVDHIDNDKTNNSVYNLQLITQRSNSLKDKSLPLSGYKGVVWSTQNKKWQVRPRVNGSKFFVGYFDCPEYASKVYIDFTNFVDNNEWSKSDLIELKQKYRKLIKEL